MQHTDFFARIRAIKTEEYKELQAAVELHGGIYEWDLEKEYGEEARFQPEEVFAGHLSTIIDYLPPINRTDSIVSTTVHTSN